jgi:hypothetical protein
LAESPEQGAAQALASPGSQRRYCGELVMSSLSLLDLGLAAQLAIATSSAATRPWAKSKAESGVVTRTTTKQRAGDGNAEGLEERKLPNEIAAGKGDDKGQRVVLLRVPKGAHNASQTAGVGKAGLIATRTAR